jgi:hypothetical protein
LLASGNCLTQLFAASRLKKIRFPDCLDLSAQIIFIPITVPMGVAKQN